MGVIFFGRGVGVQGRKLRTDAAVPADNMTTALADTHPNGQRLYGRLRNKILIRPMLPLDTAEHLLRII